jgi:hypothetical protein
VADAALGAQAGAARDHLGHQFVGVQAALHQRFGVAVADQGHGHRRRLVAVFHVHDPVLLEVEVVLLGDRADLLFRADQDRVDQVRLGGEQRALERLAVAGVHHRHVDRRQAFGALHQDLQASVLVRNGDLRHRRALGADLLAGASTSAVPETTSKSS